MRQCRLTALTVVLALGLASCAGIMSGREFASPTRDTIKNGVTTQADLVRVFGEPTQVGIDDGDRSWTWIYVKLGKTDQTKQLTVRLTPNGVVKSYSFNSNFPEDMKTLR